MMNKKVKRISKRPSVAFPIPLEAATTAKIPDYDLPARYIRDLNDANLGAQFAAYSDEAREWANLTLPAFAKSLAG